MPIIVKHDPDGGVIGESAYQAGLGMAQKKADVRAEQIALEQWKLKKILESRMKTVGISTGANLVGRAYTANKQIEAQQQAAQVQQQQALERMQVGADLQKQDFDYKYTAQQKADFAKLQSALHWATTTKDLTLPQQREAIRRINADIAGFDGKSPFLKEESPYEEGKEPGKSWYEPMAGGWMTTDPDGKLRKAADSPFAFTHDVFIKYDAAAREQLQHYETIDGVETIVQGTPQEIAALTREKMVAAQQTMNLLAAMQQPDKGQARQGTGGISPHPQIGGQVPVVVPQGAEITPQQAAAAAGQPQAVGSQQPLQQVPPGWVPKRESDRGAITARMDQMQHLSPDMRKGIEKELKGIENAKTADRALGHYRELREKLVKAEQREERFTSKLDPAIENRYLSLMDQMGSHLTKKEKVTMKSQLKNAKFPNTPIAGRKSLETLQENIGMMENILSMTGDKLPTVNSETPPDTLEAYLTKYGVMNPNDPRHNYDYKKSFEHSQRTGNWPVQAKDLPAADRAEDIAQGRNIPDDAWMFPDVGKTEGHPFPSKETPPEPKVFSTYIGKQVLSLLDQVGDRVSPKAKERIKAILIKSADPNTPQSIRVDLQLAVFDHIEMLEKIAKRNLKALDTKILKKMMRPNE